MNENTREKSKRIGGGGYLLAVALGVGVAAAAVWLAKRAGNGETLSIDSLIKGCDDAASALDDRISLAG